MRRPLVGRPLPLQAPTAFVRIRRRGLRPCGEVAPSVLGAARPRSRASLSRPPRAAALRSARVHHVSERLRAQGRLRGHVPWRDEDDRPGSADHRHHARHPAAGGAGGRARAREHDRLHAGRRTPRRRRPGRRWARRPLALRDREAGSSSGPTTVFCCRRRAAPVSRTHTSSPTRSTRSDDLADVSRAGSLQPGGRASRARRSAGGARPAARPRGARQPGRPRAGLADGAVVATLLYVDSFGNVALNLTREDVEQLGIVVRHQVELELAGERYYAVMAQDLRRRSARGT